MRRSTILLCLGALLSTAGLSLTLLSQAPPASQQSNSGFQIKLNVNLVELHVSAKDKAGNEIEGLTEANVQVLEDDKAQQVTLFKHEDVPLSIGMVIDSSGSMRNKKEKVHSAALSFVKESNPDDQTFIVAFDS